jgi:hypothetical protein
VDASGRLYAWIDARGEGAAQHYVGLPAALEPSGHRSDFPQAALLIVEPQRNSGVLLLRYSAEGEFGGDTWHEDLVAAKRQASFEYGESVDWKPVPSTEQKADELALELLRAH